MTTSRRRVASITAMSVTAAGLVVLAATREGYHTTATDLHDGTVWTIATERDSVLRVNARIDEFDTRIRNDMSSADVLQDGTSVYLALPDGIAPLNPYGTSIAAGIDPIDFPAGTQFGVAGGTSAALDPSGALWVTTAAALGGIDPDQTEPTTTVGPGSQLAVTPDGHVVVLDPTDDTVVTIDTRFSSADSETDQVVVHAPTPFGHDVPGPGDTASDVQFTAVGGTAIALLDHELLIAGNDPVDLDDLDTDSAVLQQPGVVSAEVLIADRAGLWLAPLGGGPLTPRVTGGSGPPAAPVVVGGCAYAGWEEIGRVWRSCNGDERLLDETVDGTRGTDWKFRVNRTDVVLEARGADPIHITDDGLVAIDNWKDFESDLDERDENETEEQPDQAEKAECKDGSAAPEAHDDQFGATPGVSVVLRVLDNDRDPNCDPIAIRPLTGWDDAWGQIDLIEQRHALQYTPPPTPVEFSFTYTIDDGYGGEATATVTIDSTDDTNEPPRMKDGRASATIVELFRTVSYNVLLDWEDPDGDALLLQSALLPSTVGGSLIWSKDGTITYTATDTIAGPKEIAVTVADGFGNVADGTLNISVQGEGVPLPPTARDDYVEVPAGRDLLVTPLINDTDPNNDPLVLGRYDVPDGLTVSQGEQGVLRIKVDEPGTYLVPYEATDGQLSDSATIRVEATPTDQEQRPPIAVRDSIVIQEGASVNVDVLANDYDADGDVLLLTDVSLQQTDLAGVTVDAVERQFARVHVDQDPGAPILVEYYVSDGYSPPQLGQLVVNVAPPGSQRPVPGDDRARVRANDVVDIPILANDIDPDGDEIVVLDAALDPPEQPGLLWLDGTTLRYRAGAAAGRITATYTVDDDPLNPGLNAASGFVEITVIDADATDNLPPTPPPLEARVFAGSTMTIPLPTAGLDPDGDSVTIARIGPSPAPENSYARLGVPTPRPGGIRYEANPNVQGQDVFTYELEDTFGARAVGTVRVVVVDSANHPIVTVGDAVTARPGRLLQVPVLSNDSDPDGDALILTSVEGPPELDAVVNEARVQLQLPSEPGTWQLYYTASDGKGPPRTEVLTVVAQPDAPLLPAIARDDPDPEATPPPLDTRPDGTFHMRVPVLANDDDPDGARSELRVALPPGQRVDAVVTSTGDVDVALTDTRQSIVYAVTDFDGNVSHALIRVPAAPSDTNNRAPVLRDGIPALAIPEGEPGEVVVADFVVDPDGDPVALAGESPSTEHGDVTLTSGNFDSFTFVPGGFEGGTAVVFVPVTDRPGEPDATVVLPFRISVVKPNAAPVAEPYQLDVEQLGDATPIHLVTTGAVTDPEADALTFELTSEPVTGLDVTLGRDGTVTARSDGAAEGASATYTYTVTDAQPGREPVNGTFTVRIVASTKPLVSLNAITRNDIRQGQAEVVEPLTGLANPFPDLPLKIIAADLTNGAGTVSHDDRTITFTPPDSYFGVAEVRYTVQDGTASTARHVRGAISYTVIGRPLAPGQPRVTDVASHTATISWTPSDPQGSPITDYTVTWPGGQTRTGGATNVTINTLTNNTPYTFTVTATNAVGISPPSIASQQVVPDEIPQHPNPPRIVGFGDGRLDVEWDAAVVDGSPVFQYYLTLSGGETKTFGGTARSTTWTGLTNGTEYTFSLTAENNAGRSDVSTLSNALSPARQPDAPTRPTATDVGNDLVAEVLVAWNRPATNGRDIDSYEITASAIPGQVYTSVTESIRIQLPPGLDSTFTVRAHNVVGYSPPSPASAPFEAIVAPSAPPSPTTIEQDRSIGVTNHPPASDGGDPITMYQYSVNGGAWTSLGGATGTVAGLSNGTTYTLAVRACNKKFCGPSSPVVGNLIPYGPPGLVGGTFTRSGPAAGSRDFTLNWNGTSAANGRPIVSARVDFSGGTFIAGPFSVSSGVGVVGGGSWTGNWNTTYTAVYTVWDSAGQSATRTMQIPIGAEPRPTVAVGLGPAAPDCSSTGGAQGCYYVRITVSGASSQQLIRCYGRTPTGWDMYASFTGGNGTYNGCPYSYAGRNVIATFNGTISGGPNNPAFSGDGNWDEYGPWPTD